ncbi:DNA cross-link repair 1A protein isoform X2 [Erinaceus europaeus]|uniref:DNA cross-link repair 1A protein isoform X2 n=1 Tax=Erinaceus europaeus TaxID=9365 RepID=A0ABM3VSC2_ERIEU|nr:DNA cross-link repair 1A protein isoform X2 [Erinaceus europaeus]
MFEDNILEEDIWEYKSKTKRKTVHPDRCCDNTPKSVENTTDAKRQPKRNRKKRTVEAKEKAKDPETFLGDTSSQTSVASSQSSSCGDGIQHSQDKEITPPKRSRTHKNKQVSPKIRPVYEGYCPNCQMPFSALIGQTPRWHVFECLDSPSLSGKECPDGGLCSSTIPSHYKRYTHFLLAQSRAGSKPFSSPAHRSDDTFNENTSDFHYRLEKSSPCQRQVENLKDISADAPLVTQDLRNSRSPAETSKKISSLTNIQTSQATQQLTEFVVNDKPVKIVLPLARNSQNCSKHTDAPLPENDEISYSPLESDEETYNIDEKLDDSQQELFFTENCRDGSLDDDNSRTAWFTKLPSFLPKNQDHCSAMNSLLIRDKYNEELYNSNTLNNSSQSLSQNDSINSWDDPAYSDDDFLFSPVLVEKRASSSSQAIRTKPDKPIFHASQSNKQRQVAKETADYNQTSPFLKPNMSKPSLSQERQSLSCPPTQSKTREPPGKNFTANNNSDSKCLSKKPTEDILCSKTVVLNEEKHSNILTAECNASHPASKVMKQMDIGVYFGLPPKRQEEKPQRMSALEGMDSTPASSPKEKRSRQCKRKAEKSLSDLELDTNSLNESQLELPNQRRKRRKRSDNLQEGAHRKRSDDLFNKAESEAVHFNKYRNLKESATGRQLKGNTKISESPTAGDLRKRTCPFYKKIPGTGFTVDAFQYGLVEGCTAYFLTHFHSDHYAGLSKKFTFPIYCSEITGNLLKNKLHVQEQYIHPLPMDTECVVNNVTVVLLDANHCPGAVMILFYLLNGHVILHTGDFRADPTMERSVLSGLKIHALYLDTTYCSPVYTFPSQQEVIQFAINTAFEAVTRNPRTLVVCGTYSIGKEKVFLAIADILGSKVGMTQEKYKTLRCLNIPEMNSLITTDMNSSQVHLLSMMQINIKSLQSHLKKYGGKYDQVLAFRPTGWTHSNKSGFLTVNIAATQN